MNKLFLWAIVFVVMYTTGCSSKISDQILKTEETIYSATEQTRNKSSSFPVEVFDHPRISGREVILTRDEKTDPVFRNKFVYYTQGVQKLSEVLHSVSRMTGLNIRAQEIASLLGPASRAGSGDTGASAGATGSQNILDGYVNIAFSGELGKFFDAICEQNDISWRADEKGVEFFRYQSQNFSLNIPPGTKKMNANISISGVKETTAGGTVSIGNSINIDPWASIRDGIRSIMMSGQEVSDTSTSTSSTSSSSSSADSSGPLYVSTKNGYAVLNPDIGLVTVTARPVFLSRIRKYIDSINQRFAQNILIDFRIYNVTVRDEFAAGFSIESVVKQLNFVGGGLGLQKFSIQGAPTLSPASSSPGIINIDLNYLNSNANPDIDGLANMVLVALNNMGRAALQTQGQVIAVNGQHAPFQVANEINYVSGITQTQSDVGITATVSTEKQISGVTANFLPMILGDNRILLQYQMQISQLIGLDTLTQGDYLVQLPRVSSQTLQQQIYLHDGQALLLFSFSQGRLSRDSKASFLDISKRESEDKNLFCILLYVRSSGLDFNSINNL